MEKKDKKKKKIKWKAILGILILLCVGFCGGLGIGVLIKPLVKTLSFTEFMLLLAGLYVGLILFSFLHTIIHEGGHLVCGLLTGYRFSSFRIGSFMWVKTPEGNIALKRYSLAGTGGQCLMTPPDLVDGKVPYVLYNLGGSLANIILSLVVLIPVLVNWSLNIPCLIGILWAAIGVFFGLTNAIPMRMGGMDNDGYNALSLGKNSESLKAFWLQMKINERIAAGNLSRDLPEEWFELPSDEGLQNSMIAAIAVFKCLRMMEMGQYEEADALITELLSKKTKMAGIHKKLLVNEQVYSEMVGANRPERYEELLTDEQKNFMKSMRTSTSVVRTEYLYNKYIEKDEKKAEKSWKAFELAAARYPYPQETEDERKRIEYAERVFTEREARETEDANAKEETNDEEA